MKKLDIDRSVDVAPIINVSLVIVLTLMIIAPGLDNSDHPVDLPFARAQEVEDSDRMEITCTIDGKYFIDDVEVTFEELRPMAEATLEELPNAIALVRADQDLLYGEVERVIAELEMANAPQIAIATRNEAEEEADL
jgi:biopolymer transport protein ExbD